MLYEVITNIPKEVLKVVIGCIILTSGLFVILVSRRVMKYSRGRMLALSGIASFNKAVSGGGYGPLVTSGQILSGVQGRAAVGITSFARITSYNVCYTKLLRRHCNVCQGSAGVTGRPLTPSYRGHQCELFFHPL